MTRKVVNSTVRRICKRPVSVVRDCERRGHENISRVKYIGVVEDYILRTERIETAKNSVDGVRTTLTQLLPAWGTRHQFSPSATAIARYVAVAPLTFVIMFRNCSPTTGSDHERAVSPDTSS